MIHIALLGDSTFDNAAYTDGGPDVVTHLEELLGDHGHATLLAVDGATTAAIPDQLRRLRALHARTPVTHVALSVGGNDLLTHLDMLREPATTVGEALMRVRDRALAFGEEYRTALDEVASVGLPAIVCTVYGGAFPEPEAAMIETALRIFDHEILEAAADRSIPVVDLRRVCNQREHYWNPIEPSERGGARIAAAILDAIRSA